MPNNRQLITEDNTVLCFHSNIRKEERQKARLKALKDSPVGELIAASLTCFSQLLKAGNSIKLEDLGLPLGRGMALDQKNWTLIHLSDEDKSIKKPKTSTSSHNNNKPYNNTSKSSYYSTHSNLVSKFLVSYKDHNGRDEHKNLYWSSTDKKLRTALETAGITSKLVTLSGETLSKEAFVIDKAVWKKEVKSSKTTGVLCCAYNATKKYLTNMFGVTLNTEDEKWYKDCEYVESNGLPMNHACTVINELVKPYNMKIAAVRVRKGRSTHADAPAWMAALGINDFAVSDHNISNDNFIELFAEAHEKESGAPLAEEERAELAATIYSSYKFEYHDRPFAGSILFYSMGAQTGAKGTMYPSYAAGGGHAEFKSPRETIPAGWELSIILERATSDNEFILEPPVIPVEKVEYEYHLNFWDSIYDGHIIRAYDADSTAWIDREVKQKKEGKTNLPVKKEDDSGSPSNFTMTTRKITSTSISTTNSAPDATIAGVLDSIKVVRYLGSNLYPAYELKGRGNLTGIMTQPKDLPELPEGYALFSDYSYRHTSTVGAVIRTTYPLTLPKGAQGGSWCRTPRGVVHSYVYHPGEQNPTWPSQVSSYTVNTQPVTQRELSLINWASLSEGSTPDEINKRIQDIHRSHYAQKEKKFLIDLLEKELTVRQLTSGA